MWPRATTMFQHGLALFVLVQHSALACTDDLLAGSAIATRLWKTTGGADDLSPPGADGVVTEFRTGFAPDAMVITGIQEYLGSSITGSGGNPGCSDGNVFFFNVFGPGQQNNAASVNQKAAEFQWNGALSNAIEKVEFLEGNIDFSTSNQCVKSSVHDSPLKGFAGKHLGTRKWKVNAGQTGITGQTIVDLFREGFRSTLRERAADFSSSASSPHLLPHF